jgi:hypothetical protein
MRALTIAIILCVIGQSLAGCGRESRGSLPPGSATEADLAKTCAAELRKAMYVREEDEQITPGPGGMLYTIPSDKLKHAWTYVRSHFEKGDVSGLAALINVDGPWHNTMWYGEVCGAFASCFTGQRPLKMKGLDIVERALKQIASEGEDRQTRVYAAIALRYDDLGLAKKVLLQEYANFRLDGGHYPLLYDPPAPVACGPTLIGLGVQACYEVTSLSELWNTLHSRGIEVNMENTKDRLYLAETANRFNALIRKGFVDHDKESMVRLAEYQLDEGDNPIWALRAIWKDVHENWKPPEPDPAHGLFAPTPGSVGVAPAPADK